MNWQRTKRLARLSLRWLNWTLLLPTLLGCMLLTLLLFTPAGLTLNLWFAEKVVPGLSIADSEGSLLGGNTLHQIHWRQGDNSISVKQLSLAFDNRCLLKLALCIDTLALNDISVSWHTRSGDTTTADSGAQAFWLPFALELRQLSLNQAQLNIDEYQLNWQHLSSGITAWGNKLQLNTPLWQQVQLTLPANDNPGTDKANLRYVPPQLPELRLPLQLFVDRFRLEHLLIQQHDSQQRLDEILISLQWQDHQLNLTQLDIHHPQGQMQSSAKLNTSADYALSANLQAQLTAGKLAGQQLELKTAGDLRALDIELTARGILAGQAFATLDLLSSTLSHQLELSVEHLHWPPARAQPPNTALSVSGAQLALKGSLNHSELSGRLTLTPHAAPPMAITLNGAVNLHSLTLDQLQIDTLGGQINSPLTLHWQQGLHWQAATRLHAIQPGLFWPDYPGELDGSLTHQGRVLPDRSWQLALEQLNIQGTLRDERLALTGRAMATDPGGSGQFNLTIPGLTLHHADNSLRLTGTVNQDWALAMQLSVTDLGQSLAGASGTIDGNIQLSGPRITPQLDGRLTATNMAYADGRLEQLQLDSRLWLDQQQQWHTTLTLNAQNGRYRQQPLTQLTLDFAGQQQQHRLKLSLDAAEHQANIVLQGSLTAEHWQGQLLQAQLNSLLGPWQLAAPTALNVDMATSQLKVQEHCWQQAQSRLCAKAPLQLSPQNVSANISLTQFGLNRITALLPANSRMQGNLDASATLNWQQGQALAGSLKLTAPAGSFTQQLSSPMTLSWQALNLHTELDNNSIANQLDIQFTEQASLGAKVTIGHVNTPDKPLSGHLRINQFAIDFLQPLLGELSDFSGQLDSELQLSGTLNQPLLHGKSVLKDGKVKGRLAPADIENARVVLAFDGDKAQLDGLIRSNGGEIKLQGNADWQQLANWQAQLTVQGDALRLQVPQASLLVAPNLTLTAKPNFTRITGTVLIPSATINVDSLPQSAVQLSDDTVLLDKQLQPTVTRQQALFALETDINVQMGNRVRLSAFGLKTRLAGNLRVRQQSEQPLRLNGDVNLIDGTFRAYGQDLLIRKGSMNFNGPADQPFLNVEAIRNPDNMEDDVIAGIRVNGPADNPSVVVFSEPAKAQASALAYLLMGRDLDSSSGSTGNAVTTSLIGMTLSSSSKVVGEIGEAFGLRDLTLDTAGAGDNSQVTVSGYLSRDIQLKYGYGIFNAVGEFTLRYRLMRRLYLEAVSGLDNAVDLLYKFEFD